MYFFQNNRTIFEKNVQNRTNRILFLKNKKKTYKPYILAALYIILLEFFFLLKYYPFAKFDPENIIFVPDIDRKYNA